jgi:hypothetical protein
MSLKTLGVRYERLLILAAPVTFACVLVAFIALGSEAIADKKNADCYDKAAYIVEQNFQNLLVKWEEREKMGEYEFAKEYALALAHHMIYGIGSSCEYEIGTQDATSSIPPLDFSKKLKAEADRIRKESAEKPVRYYGIEIPEKATLKFFGIKLTIGVLTLAQVLQLILGPVLILWLGSLFNTRFRETLLIESAGSISELHPHCLNLYLSSKIPELRKRSISGYYLKLALPYMPTIFRIFLLSIFIVPSTTLYCASLFYLASEDYVFISIMAGSVVAFFALVNLVAEMNPWHSGRSFPSPKYFDRR